MSRPVDDVFAFFAEAANLELITPPWLGFSLVSRAPVLMGPGALIEYRLRLHRLPLRWMRYRSDRIGELAHAPFVERDLARIFDFRRAAVARLLA